jgi:hypothetical protein
MLASLLIFNNNLEVLINSESDISFKYESGSQTIQIKFLLTYQTMIGYAPLSSICDNSPF